MYREVNWAVPADPYILEELGEYDGWHTAKNLEINTDFSRQWISQRCPVFVDHELAERHEEEPHTASLSSASKSSTVKQSTKSSMKRMNEQCSEVNQHITGAAIALVKDYSKIRSHSVIC